MDFENKLRHRILNKDELRKDGEVSFPRKEVNARAEARGKARKERIAADRSDIKTSRKMSEEDRDSSREQDKKRKRRNSTSSESVKKMKEEGQVQF